MAYQGEIGWRRGTVQLVAHDPKWAQCFKDERDLLFRIIGEKIVNAQHIGSTSIPGMPAKPIIDILLAVKALADVEALASHLSKVGYQDKGTGGVPGRRYFVKGGETERTHHLNFCEMNSSFWVSHIAFRDYLIQHPEIVGEYSALKRVLADKFPNDRAAYSAGKQGFVQFVLHRALKKT
jgi:GrpB-like predicted nucleotidyltransferase (UPF0157 family)